MNETRILVLGATGQVGRAVSQVARVRNPQLALVEAARSSPDAALRFSLDDPPSLEKVIRRIAPRHTILAAAATSVAWCEANPEAARRVNVDGTEVVAAVCRAVGSSLTFISTDYVFDGTTAPSGEADPVAPRVEYGRQKLAAESIVLGTHPGNLVVRTCQVFGPDPRRKNFVLATIDRLTAGERVSVAADLFGTPTYAPDLAAMLLDLTVGGRTGVWHVAGASFLSRYDLALAAAAAFGVTSPALTPVRAEQLGDGVPRPPRAGLRNERLDAEGLARMTPLATALADLAEWDAAR